MGVPFCCCRCGNDEKLETGGSVVYWLLYQMSTGSARAWILDIDGRSSRITDFTGNGPDSKASKADAQTRF